MSQDSGAAKFDKFLKDNGISIRRAAESLHVSDPTILDWRNDRKTPSPEHRVAIRTWTKGAIAEGDWQTKREREQAKSAALVKPFEPEHASETAHATIGKEPAA